MVHAFGANFFGLSAKTPESLQLSFDQQLASQSSALQALFLPELDRLFDESNLVEMLYKFYLNYKDIANSMPVELSADYHKDIINRMLVMEFGADRGDCSAAAAEVVYVEPLVILGEDSDSDSDSDSDMGYIA